MFWERFIKLCVENNKKPNPVASELGISSGAVTKWKKEGATPNDVTLQKIADYFGVKKEYFSINIQESRHAIGYVDILGAKKDMLSENSEQQMLIYKDLYKRLIDACKRCNNLLPCDEIKIKIFSDNILIALECNDKTCAEKAYIIIMILSYFQFDLFFNDCKLLRGCVCVDKLYLDNIFVFGKGLVDAYTAETTIAKYPRIILDKALVDIFDKEEHADLKFIKIDSNDKQQYVNYLIPLKEIKDTKALDNCYKIIREKISDEQEYRVLDKLYWTYASLNQACKEMMYAPPKNDLAISAENKIRKFLEARKKENDMFYDNLSILCKKHNTTVTALVLHLGLSSSNATTWKNNRPSVDALIKLADYFNVSVDYLLGRTDTPEKHTEDNPIYAAYNALNNSGKQEAEEYIKYLLTNSKYIDRQKIHKETSTPIQSAAMGEGVSTTKADLAKEEIIKRFKDQEK